MKTKRSKFWMTPVVTFLMLIALTQGCKKDDYVEVPGVCPVVESTNPANGAINVPLRQIVTATFNKEMNPATITQSSFSLTGGLKADTKIEGVLTYNNTNATLSFVPTLALEQNTTYTGTVKSTIKDLDGNALQTNYVWTFSTGVIVSPTVISTDPGSNATGVFVNKVITATFSIAMDPLTITAATIKLYQGTTPVAGTVSYSGVTASFTPAAPLTPNTVYTGTITTGAKNLAGTPLESNYVWSFTTGSVTGPTVISTDPTNNATGVSLDKTVTATFSMAMDPLTINSTTFTMKQGLTTVSGIVTYSGTTASFDPSGPLTANALYVCTITTGAKNLAGIALTENYVWSFTAGSFTPPTVISTDPANLATGVFLAKAITATFSVPMDPLTMNGTTFTITQGLTSIAGTVTYSGSTATFTPTVNLLPGTIYTGTITTGAKNTAGIAIAANYVWTFTTLTPATPPAVISTDPANNAINVALDKTITATFNMPMDPLTMIAANFTIYHGTTPIGGTVSYSGSTITFNPLSALLPNTVYTGTITNAVKNPAGVSMASNYVWTFTTLTPVAPLVISTDPANNATNVALNKTVRATFNMPMDPLTMVAANFTVYHGTTPIGGTISYSGSTISFVPLSSLLVNTVYTCTVTTGAKNLAGASLASAYVWTFTTLSPVNPIVISTDPANNAINVALDKTITATFNMPMDPLTMIAANFTVFHGTTAIGGTVSYSGSTITFNPSSALLPNTVYTSTITNAVKNPAGVAMVSNYVWTFTTLTPLAPFVITTDPANNAINVALDKTVAATFNMPMDPLTMIAANFTVFHGTTPIVGTVSYSGSTITFNPLSALLPNTVYTGTITNAVKNLAGVAMASNYVWTFTTLTPLAPIVISTDPANNAINVALDKTVTATFNMPMDPLTMIAANFTIYHGTTPIGGTVSYSGSTITFNPLSTLLANTVYTCTITNAVKNPAGVSMASNYVWTFTTLTPLAPLVISTDPMNNAMNVALDKTVTATFNMPMDPLTMIATNFTIYHGTTPIGGTVSYSGSTITFNPLSTLLANTVYTCTITNAVKNLAGVPMASNYVWTFTTLTPLAPAVISTDPLNNAINVAVNKTVTATFNMPMDALTLTNLTFTLKQGLTTVTGVVTYSGSTASFNPDTDLASNKLYTATITTGAKNPAGVPLAADYVWSFTTLTVVVPPLVDLGGAAMFGAFGGNAGVTNQGLFTVINGAIGTTAASTLITGFHDGLTGDVYTETPLNVGLVTNGIFTAPPFPGTATSFAIASKGLLDAQTAYNFISPASMPGGMDPGAGELGGLTLAPGVYKSASGTFNISNGPLTLDAQGDPNATWVFQTAAGLTVGIAGPTGARSIILINGALPKNVFWYVGTAATINGAGGGTMVGTIIAYSGVTFSTAGNVALTVLNGRAISLVASVTMVNTIINVPGSKK